MKKKGIVGVFIIYLVYFIGSNTLSEIDLKFHHSTVEVQVNSEFDAISNIKAVTNKEVVAIENIVDTSILGNYEIRYTLNNKIYQYSVEVVDHEKPIVNTKNLTIIKGQSITPDQFIESVEDDTTTTVSFLKEYTFNKIGKNIITIIVEDVAGNQTKCNVGIEVVEDTDPPYVLNMETLYSSIYTQVDYYEGIQIEDNYDQYPIVELLSSNVNIDKTGTYEATYILKDSQGNNTTVNRDIVITSDKTIYLTFDDGPSSNTKKILEILEAYDVNATFFVCGLDTTHYYLIEEAYLLGNAIGVHTYSHDYAEIYRNVDSFFNDIQKMNDIIYEYTGSYSTILRFPGGSSNTISARYTPNIMTTLTSMVTEEGFTYFDWNVSSGDAESRLVETEDIIKASTSSNAKNINILFHDSALKTTTVDALPTIIEYYQANGYSFEVLDENSYPVHHNIQN